jgi:hypothetical protein
MSTAMKVDYRRELRSLYAPGSAPTIVEVPGLAYLMADGHGDPNTAPEFGEAIEALFAVAYAAKVAVKRAPEGIDYGVMPLEGLFWTSDPSTFTSVDRSAWDWTLMIMQSGLVTAEVFAEAQATARKRKSPSGPRSSGCTPSSPSSATSAPESITRSTSVTLAAPLRRSSRPSSASRSPPQADDRPCRAQALLDQSPAHRR